MAKKLTAAQERELKYLYENEWEVATSELSVSRWQVFTNLRKMGLVEITTSNLPIDIHVLTSDGLQLARELFGSNDPDPDDSEPLPVVADAPAETKPVSRVQWHTPANLSSENMAYLDYMARYKARQSAPTPRRQAKQARVVCLPNMQRKSPEIAVTREIPKRETVLQIVSRIQTPLTSQVRRIA